MVHQERLPVGSPRISAAVRPQLSGPLSLGVEARAADEDRQSPGGGGTEQDQSQGFVTPHATTHEETNPDARGTAKPQNITYKLTNNVP